MTHVDLDAAVNLILSNLAGKVGIEPTTHELTVRYSTAELHPIGDSYTIRTYNPKLRRLVLCPVELRSLFFISKYRKRFLGGLKSYLTQR